MLSHSHHATLAVCHTLHMVPSPRGKRWTVPDSCADATAGEASRAAAQSTGVGTKYWC